jgi:adenylosuccinate lyase
MPFKAMQHIFNEKARFQRWLDIESALAEVEASLGIIPQEAAREISAKARIDLLSIEDIKKNMERLGHPVVSLIRPFQEICAGEAGEYVHYGPTTQDIIDTGDQIAMKAAHQIIFDTLRDIEESLLVIAEREADTLIAGRTHGGHALPITFGFKVAVWVREIRRHIERLKESRKRLFVGLLSGAVGTFASYGEKGPEIEAGVMKKLGLGVPDICWAAARDRNAEFACLLAMCAGTLGKIANEIYTLQRTEVSELEERVGSAVGSSTMPHKRNPRNCETSLELAIRVKYFAMMQLDGMKVEHERGMSGWYIQRDTIGDMCLIMGDLLSKMKIVTRDLVVNSARMRKNLEITKGLILSEPVMFELGKSIGKQTAHEVIFDATNKAFEESMSLKSVLLDDARVSQYLTSEDLDRILDPMKHTGLSSKIARDMVALTRKEREQD